MICEIIPNVFSAQMVYSYCEDELESEKQISAQQINA